MRRGEVRRVDLDPTHGSEAAGRRPAVIVSNDAANETAARLGRGTVTVVPITSNVRRVYPFESLVPAGTTGLARESKALAEQVRSVEVRRLGDLLGRLEPDAMAALDGALRLHLAL